MGVSREHSSASMVVIRSQREKPSVSPSVTVCTPARRPHAPSGASRHHRRQRALRALSSGTAGKGCGRAKENEGRIKDRKGQNGSLRAVLSGAAGGAEGFPNERRRAAPCGAAHPRPGAQLAAARSPRERPQHHPQCGSARYRNSRASPAVLRGALLCGGARGVCFHFWQAVPPGEREPMSALRSTSRRSSAAVRERSEPGSPRPAFS